MFALGMIYPKFSFENPNLDSIVVWLLSRVPITSPTSGKRWGMDESILKEVSNMNLHN
jgi:hypothetical protein